MKRNYLARDLDAPFLVTRVSKPFHKCETVLTTDVLPLIRAQRWHDSLVAIGNNHRDAWYLRYTFEYRDAAEAVKRVPSVIAQMNRSRVLRRAKISGARMCVIQQWHGRKSKYISNLVCSCSFDAMVFASLLNTFDRFDDQFYIDFKPLSFGKRNRKNVLRAKFDDLVEKFYRRSKLPRNTVGIHRCEDSELLGALRMRITTVKPIFDVALMACDIFGDEVDGISFGDGSILDLSRSPNIDIDDYAVRPFDTFTNNFVYRQFRGFGIYSDNREIQKLL